MALPKGFPGEFSTPHIANIVHTAATLPQHSRHTLITLLSYSMLNIPALTDGLRTAVANCKTEESMVGAFGSQRRNPTSTPYGKHHFQRHLSSRQNKKKLEISTRTQQFSPTPWSVSYTHLTLPTILLV